VTVTAPGAGQPVVVGATITLGATSTDADGTVTRVEFFVGGAKVGEALAEPFTAPWTPSAPGLRVLTARATDDRGAFALSAPVTVTVQAAGGGDVLAPVATLVTPAAGTRDLTGSVLLQATATDNVGVTEVQFDLDGVLLATATAPPFVATVPSTADYTSGAHLVRARARDAAGNWSDWSVSPVTFAGTTALPAGLRQTVHVAGFAGIVTAIAVAPDGRMFATEQNGSLRVVRNGQLLPQPFVTLPVDPTGERGLLGVALHPDFATNSLLYLYYTTPDGGTHNRISRFVAAADTALAAGEMVLVDLPSLNSVPKHNGGAMAFGADGKLYVAVGDNTDAALAPSLASPFGKMLRFNADGSIPADNPFLGQTTGINRAIWARGLRNPFTFAIQPGTGRIHINDVGASAWEEINLGRAGADFGWPATEGPTGNPQFDSPLLSYGHAGGATLFTGGAVVGAAFYHPGTPLLGAQYLGSYFFADYVDGWIYRIPAVDEPVAVAFAQTAANPTGLVVGSDGALYVLIGSRIDRIAP
jgi:glucose/arabinose dehydrogenase